MYYVYGEVIILVNFIVNYIILLLSSKLLKKKTSNIRIIIASIIGSIYVIFSINNSIFNTLAMKILLSISIVYISFNPKKIRDLLVSLLIFYIATILCGGAVLALVFMTYGNIDTINEIYGIKIPVLILGILLAFKGAIKLKNILIDVKIKDMTILDINISINSNIVNLKGFTDTGCSLTDTLSGMPVLLIEFDCIKKILPDELINYIIDYDNIYNLNIHQNIKDINILKKIRFIPYSTIDGKDNYLISFQTDFININMGKNIKRIDKGIIAICNRKINNCNEFQALINPKLLMV